MAERHLFTSESVGMGHPDKVADQVSDAIVDALLTQDPRSRIACETLVTTGLCVISGEITTTAKVDYGQIARDTICSIGYTDEAFGISGEGCGVLVAVHSQSPDISQGVTAAKGKEQGAGDQGMMFGYACRETPELMPMPIMYAHRLVQKLADLRGSGKLAWARPDCKTQVTVEYIDGKPARVEAVVVSVQHAPEAKLGTIRKSMIDDVITKVIPDKLLDAKTKIHVNPTGRFVVGGPHGDTGLTGRKIIVDTYGGMGRHGGGAFSGKDPSKVDRSAAYAARWVAKNVVAAKLADRCEFQLAYAIGVAEPVSIGIDTFGTARVDDEKILAGIRKVFHLTPGGIIKSLDLLKPGYIDTARHGHFGRTGKRFTWEQTDKAAALAKACGL
jgi:S-adenosylmethionine synthetase